MEKVVSASRFNRENVIASVGRFDRVSRSARTQERAELLRTIQEKWGCGSIRPDRSDKTLKVEIRNVSELVAKVLPHFRAYPLLSSKKADFERFARICELVNDDWHLERDCLEEIVRLAVEKNPSGKRKYIGSGIF